MTRTLEARKKTQNIAAHRGMSGLYPENTLAAFKAVKRAGFSWIEADISMLRDETMIIFHDDSQGRTVPGHKKVSDLCWSDFENVDVGAWKGAEFSNQKVLRLEDLLIWADENDMALILEMKCHGSRQCRSAEVLLSKIGHDQKRNILVSSFDLDFLRNIRSLAPKVRLASIHSSLPENVERLKRQLSIEAVHLDNKLVQSEAEVKLFHDRGILVRVWTVNKKSRAKHLFNLGVDMVMSDYPERIGIV